MLNDFLALKTDPKLLSALTASAQRGASATERFEQRVSFVFSAMSEKGGATRDQVREMVLAQDNGRIALSDNA